MDAKSLPSLATCGLNTPAPDLLTPSRAAAAIWSWAEGHPFPSAQQQLQQQQQQQQLQPARHQAWLPTRVQRWLQSRWRAWLPAAVQQLVQRGTLQVRVGHGRHPARQPCTLLHHLFLFGRLHSFARGQLKVGGPCAGWQRGAVCSHLWGGRPLAGGRLWSAAADCVQVGPSAAAGPVHVMA